LEEELHGFFEKGDNSLGIDSVIDENIKQDAVRQTSRRLKTPTSIGSSIALIEENWMMTSV